MFMKPGPTQKKHNWSRTACIAWLRSQVGTTPMLASYACTVTSCVLHVLLQLFSDALDVLYPSVFFYFLFLTIYFSNANMTRNSNDSLN